jgi:hypothetical protein
VGRYIIVRPQDDAASIRAGNWAALLIHHPDFTGHTLVQDVDGFPYAADQTVIVSAVSQAAEIVLYFGHGRSDAWTTNDQVTIDSTNVTALKGKAVVAVACKSGLNLAADAITGGVSAYLGFGVKVVIPARTPNGDPIGDAFVEALAELGTGETMQQVSDTVAKRFADLADDYDTGSLSGKHNSLMGYLATRVIADHVILQAAQGMASLAPLP